MEGFISVLEAIDGVVWGPIMLTILVGTGIYLTIRTNFLCWRNLGHAIGNTLSKEARQTSGEGDVSPFAALCTALAARSRRSRRSGMDVDLCRIRPHIQVHRVRAGCALPCKK